METVPQRPTGREDIISTLNAAIAALNLARNSSNIGTAKTVFHSAIELLITARVCFSLFHDNWLRAHSRLGLDSNNQKVDFVELGLFCADICKALDWGTSGRSSNKLNRSVHDVINLLVVS